MEVTCATTTLVRDVIDNTKSGVRYDHFNGILSILGYVSLSLSLSFSLCSLLSYLHNVINEPVINILDYISRYVLAT